MSTNSIVLLPHRARRASSQDFDSISIPVKLKKPEDSHPTNGIYILGDRVWGEEDPKKAKGLTIDALTIRGFVETKGENAGTFGDLNFVYDDCLGTVDLPKAKAMAKTLEKLAKAMEGKRGTLENMIAALGAVFGPIQFAKPAGSFDSYSDTTWRFLSPDVLILEFEAYQAKVKRDAEVYAPGC